MLDGRADSKPDFWIEALKLSQAGTGASLYGAVFDDDEGGDDVDSPEHYIIGGVEAIDVLKAKLSSVEYRGYLKGAILKYFMRANYKGKHDQDIAKAAWYMEELVAELNDQAE